MSEQLRALRDIAPDPERMLAVRRRVLAAIAAEVQPNWPLRLAWAFSAATVAVAILTLWPRPGRLDPSWIELPHVAEPPAFAYELTPLRPAPSKPRSTAVEPKRPAIEVVGPTEDGVQLRLASGDPDVILYYFLDKPGD